jgi:hypothetical protein
MPPNTKLAMYQTAVVVICFEISEVDRSHHPTCPGKVDQNWHQAVPHTDQMLPATVEPHTRGSEGSLLRPEQACSLDAMRIDRSDAEIKVLVRALNIVACAFRPLDAGELIEALTTPLPPLVECQDWQGDASWLRTSEDLETLCFGFLEIGDSGVVQFSDHSLKNSVLSHEFAKLNLPCGSDGHELLAMVCIQHLQCLSAGKLLRPWMAATRRQTEVKHECALLSYTTTFWHEHSRIALLYSREIPAMLHRAFMSAISSEEDQELTLSEKTNMGLWLSTVNNFSLLCRTYLEMGADPNSCSDWHEAPIHTAARSATGDVIRLLVERGADLDLRNGKGLAPLHIACRSGNIEAVQTLIELGADLNAEISIETLLYKGARTPLHHAVICGRLEVVRMLFNQPRPGTHGLRQIKVELEDLGSGVLAFVFSCVKEEDRRWVMDLLDFDFSIRFAKKVVPQDHNALVVQPVQPDYTVPANYQCEVLPFEGVFAAVVDFILLPERESVGVDHHPANLSKLGDRTGWLQLNQVIEDNFLLVALRTDISCLPWVRFSCTRQTANSQIPEQGRSPEISPVEVHLTAGALEPDISPSHEFCGGDLLTTHARQQFLAKADIEDKGKHGGCFLQTDESYYAHTIPIRSRYVEITLLDVFGARLSKSSRTSHTNLATTNSRATDGEDWTMVEKNEVDARPC